MCGDRYAGLRVESRRAAPHALRGDSAVRPNRNPTLDYQNPRPNHHTHQTLEPIPISHPKTRTPPHPSPNLHPEPHPSPTLKPNPDLINHNRNSHEVQFEGWGARIDHTSIDRLPRPVGAAGGDSG